MSSADSFLTILSAVTFFLPDAYQKSNRKNNYVWIYRRREIVTTYQTPIVAGVFQNPEQAKNAFDMLRNAGFNEDQVGVALPGSSNVKDGLAEEFKKLGVPQDRALYYEREFNAGHIVVSVRPEQREQEAKTILHNNGGYDYGENTSSPAQSAQQQQSQSAQSQPGNQPSAGNYGQQDYRANDQS
jgi:hypothetical protein